MAYSFVNSAQGYANSLHSQCHLRKHDPQDSSRAFWGKTWDALWDTGATCSVITPNIVKELNIAPSSYTFVSGVHGKARAAQYYIDFGLPNGVMVPKVLVVEGNPAGCDLLIGMDIIGLGDFVVSCCNGSTQFGLRMPSEITREEMLEMLKDTSAEPTVKTGKQVGRNSPCPCGSGIKYKRCCGKA